MCVVLFGCWVLEETEEATHMVVLQGIVSVKKELLDMVMVMGFHAGWH